MDLPIGLKRCDVSLNGDLDPGRSIPVVPKSHEGVLTEKELVDYKDQRVKFLSWLLNFGKSPDKGNSVAFDVGTITFRAWFVIHLHPQKWEVTDVIACLLFQFEFVESPFTARAGAFAPVRILIVKVVLFDHGLTNAPAED